MVAMLATACVGHPADDEDDEFSADPSGEPAVEVTGVGLVLDFTATWCVNCPRMATAIEEAMAERPGAIFPVSVHFRDEFSYGEGEALAALFAIQAYPSLIVNLDKGTLTTATSRDIIFARMDAFTPGKPCTLEADCSEGLLTAGVTAAQEGSYRIGALLLEDGLVAPQTGGSQDYVHDNILRKILSTDIWGEDLGMLSEGAAVKKKFPVGDLGDGDFHAVVYVTCDGVVNNAADVRISL